MTQFIPVQPIPAQILRVALGGQSCRLRIYQRSTGLYIDVYVNDVLFVGGVLCVDRADIIRDLYFGFNGDLRFVDIRGTDDPHYTGLGDRWRLVYMQPSWQFAPA